MQCNKTPISRRDLVAHLGAGLTGAAVAFAVPGITQTPHGESTGAPFVDSATKYPKPPYDIHHNIAECLSRFRANPLLALGLASGRT